MRSLSRLLVRGGAAAAALGVLAAPPAQAQTNAGSFACLTPTVFVAQGASTQLNALTYGTGSSTFTPIGPPAGVAYNAIGFNPVDSFIYGIRSDGALLRIDDAGHPSFVASTSVGGVNIGAFDEQGRLFATAGGRTDLHVIDVATGTTTRLIALSAPTRAADLTFIDGLLWGQEAGTPNLVRVDPDTGRVDRFAQTGVPSSVLAGASWTYGNGNLGLSDNTSGRIFQVAIEGAAGPSPSFRLVSSADGPSSGNNDGTSCPGRPVDLAIDKSGPAKAYVGQAVTWTLTVRNDGPGTSSGYTVTDAVPAAFTGVTSPTPGCEVAGNTVTCAHGPQEAGQTAAFTITATAAQTYDGENAARVTGNDADPVPANDLTAAPVRVVELVGLCRGTPVSLLELRPATANPAETPCRTDDRWIARIYQSNLLETLRAIGTEVHGTSTREARAAAATADIAGLTLGAPGLSLKASGLHSEVRSQVGASCEETSTSGASHVTRLELNGRTYLLGSEPRTIPLGIGEVRINDQVVDGATITQRAIYVDLPGTALDVAVAESRAGLTCAS